jgi:orotate phosphoribosyltransferase
MREEKIAEVLLRVKAVTLSPGKPYTYASGIRSPIYCDNRILISHVVERKEVVDAFLEMIEELEFDVIAGTATAGIPWAAWVASKLDKPMVYIRGKAKEHGKGNQIEGGLSSGQKVLVVEDLISTGGSSREAVDAVRAAGCEVVACAAIFTYEMKKATAKFEDIKLMTLTKFSTLVEVANKTDYIDEEQKQNILEWNKDPEGWADKVGV